MFHVDFKFIPRKCGYPRGAGLTTECLSEIATDPKAQGKRTPEDEFVTGVTNIPNLIIDSIQFGHSWDKGKQMWARTTSQKKLATCCVCPLRCVLHVRE
jgi:hypothetical protein